MIEARERSGTLVTAGHAAAQGIDVFALPGPAGRGGLRRLESAAARRRSRRARAGGRARRAAPGRSAARAAAGSAPRRAGRAARERRGRCDPRCARARARAPRRARAPDRSRRPRSSRSRCSSSSSPVGFARSATEGCASYRRARRVSYDRAAPRRGNMSEQPEPPEPPPNPPSLGQSHVVVVGAGLAGCEAAWQAARRGLDVVLHEMKPEQFSPGAHLARLRRARVQQLAARERPRQCRGAAQGGDAPARLARDRGGRRDRGAGRQGAGGRPRGLREAHQRGDRIAIRGSAWCAAWSSASPTRRA